MAPKEIRGQFPRLSQSCAEAVVEVTECARNKEEIPEDMLERVRDHKSKGFKCKY